MTDPFFTIVIPTYNRADLIGKTLDSLCEQTYFQFEIIIVDDGSTDNTSEVVEHYLADPRIFHFSKKNGERGAARNFGATKARGSYINFFDSDDLAYPNHLQEARKAIDKLNRPEVFHLSYDMRSPDGKKWRNVDQLPETINRELLNGNHLSCNGVFLRKDIALKFPFSEERSLSASEDYALWLALAARFHIHCINTITSTIVDHEQRSVVNIDMTKFLTRMNLLNDVLVADEQVQLKYKDNWSEFLAYRNIYIALHLAMAKYPKKYSLHYLKLAVQNEPRTIFSRRFFGALKNIFL
jgi:glycosyltransferase involved in cell wall biosynthesis